VNRRPVVTSETVYADWARETAAEHNARLERGECWCHAQPVRYCPGERARIEGNYARGIYSDAVVWAVSL